MDSWAEGRQILYGDNKYAVFWGPKVRKGRRQDSESRARAIPGTHPQTPMCSSLTPPRGFKREEYQTFPGRASNPRLENIGKPCSCSSYPGCGVCVCVFLILWNIYIFGKYIHICVNTMRIL